MTELMEEFDMPDFSVDKYTKKLVKECIGGVDLQQRKKEIQSYSDQTSATLKKSVYANYMQFIETAKEISHLESEMYQLSHILIEQRNILASLTDEKTPGGVQTGEDGVSEEQATQEDAENSHATRAVKEMVQGFNGNLEGKTFLNEGALIELDPNDYRPIQRVFFFLFNDVLIVCKVKHDKRLEFLTEYDPKKIAVINIKDLDGVRNAINIITPDGSKIFQSVTAAGKSEWIEKLEVAFRFDQQQKKTTKKNPAPQPPKMSAKQQSVQESPTKNKSLLPDLSSFEPHTDKIMENQSAEWMIIAGEEIQTLIAQRHFEDAQAYIKRTQAFLINDKSFTNANAIRDKVKSLETQLTDVLLQELSNCHCRNLQVTLRASRRSLKILVDLGHARHACGTFLKVATVGLRSAQREARRNNTEISELFFCDLTQVACEFLSAFQTQPACVSALVVWCNVELQYFASQLIKHYLTKGTHLDAVSKCIESIRKPCAKLTDIGLDLSYHLEGLLRTTIDSLIEESRVRLIETVGRNEETWQPYNLQTKSNLKRLLLDFDTIGINMRAQTTGDTWINLTQSTVTFTRHYLQLTAQCAYLAKSEVLSESLETLLRDLMLAQQAVKVAPGLSVDPNFVQKNKRFLFEELLPIAIESFHKIRGGGRKCEILLELQRQLRKQLAPVPKQRSVYQTDLTDIGLDLSYHLEGLLRTTIDSLIEESRVRLIETVGRNEETWQPYNLQTKSNLKRLLLDFDTIGINMRAQTTGDTWINLTQSTVTFTRHYLQLTAQCAYLAKSEVLSESLETLLRDLMLAQQAVKVAPGLSVDPNFVQKNKRFLFEELLPIAIESFHKIRGGGRKCEILLELQRQLRKQLAPVPKQRSVYQTDLTDIGLDLSYHLEGLLRTTIDSLIEESRVRLIETVGRNEETWQPYNLQTKSNLKRLLLDFDTIGINMRAQTTGDTWINLTQSTVTFTRHYLQLTAQCAYLAKSEVLSESLETLLRDLMLAQQAVKVAPGLSVDPNFVQKNKRFLFEELLPIAIESFHKIRGGGRKCEILLELQRQLRKQLAPVPKQRSVYQTDVF